MENQPVCPKCGGDCKFIPQGVSKKTGKPYDAFWSCKNYGCGGTLKVGANASPSAKSYATAQKSINSEVSQSVASHEARKESAMTRFATGRDAVIIVTTLYPQLKEISDMDMSKDDLILEKIKEWQKKLNDTIYADKPFI
jgi:hypothetical protein